MNCALMIVSHQSDTSSDIRDCCKSYFDKYEPSWGLFESVLFLQDVVCHRQWVIFIKYS